MVEAAVLEVQEEKHCSSCGKEGHANARSKACLNNKRAKTALLAAESGEIPTSFEDQWKALGEPDEYIVEYDTHMISKAFDSRFKDHTETVWSQVTQLCEKLKHERDDTGMFSRHAIFESLSQLWYSTQLEWANKRMAKNDRPIELWELQSFVAMFIFAEQMNLTHEIAFELLHARILLTHPKTAHLVLEIKRFKQIWNLLSTHSPDKDIGDENSWPQTIDTIAKMRDFENSIYEKSRIVAITRSMCAVIDDELVSSRSKELQSKSISNRKAGKEGGKNDAIADSFLRTFLMVKHQERVDYNQGRTVAELLDVIQQVLQGSPQGLWLTADRGYSCLEMWLNIAKRDMAFLMICNTKENKDQPFRPSSIATEKTPKEFIVQEGMLLGRQILTATRSCYSSKGNNENKRKITCIAFRNETKPSKTTAGDKDQVLTFVECGTNQASALSNTICLEKRTLPKGYDLGRDALFSPVSDKDKTPAVKEAEKFFASKVKPLTCWQRSADWFENRMFHITGTAGQDLAKLNFDVRKLLFKDPTWGIQADNWGKSDEEVATLLRNSWIYRSDVSTQEMQSGTINECNIAKCIKRKDWCIQFFDIGLVASKESRCLAVSADGIVQVRLPEYDTIVWASAEFKTKLAPNQVKKAEDVRSKYGSTFVCKVGDDRYWEAVPTEYRGQIIQQAAVLDLDWVVYACACKAQLRYVCFVNVPIEARKTYSESLTKWSHLIDWAHKSIDEDGPPPEPPQAFSPADRELLSSRFRLWRAIQKRMKKDGHVLYPVYIFKSWAQVMYNKMKGGVDGSTQFVEELSRSTSLPSKLSTKLNLRALKHMVINSFIMWRIGKVKTSNSKWKTVFQFRNYGNVHTEPLKTFAFHLVAEILESAKEKFDNCRLRGPSQEMNESPSIDLSSPIAVSKEERKAFFQENKLQENSRGKKRRLAFNTETGKRIRLGGGAHLMVSIKQATCAICNVAATNKCSTCEVPLHVSKKSGITNGMSCYDRWHSVQILLANDSAKKRKKLDQKKQSIHEQPDTAITP
jgi:hypothetical protein